MDAAGVRGQLGSAITQAAEPVRAAVRYIVVLPEEVVLLGVEVTELALLFDLAAARVQNAIRRTCIQ